MSEIKTYPEMNETIKSLLRRSEKPMNRYILARIEELEKQVSSLAPPPNDPLTKCELRKMIGEPIWMSSMEGDKGHWEILSYDMLWDHNCYGKTWLAYRRNPDEIVHCKDCKHLYFKDMTGYCPHMVGPCRPEGFCDRGERKEEEKSQ